MWHVYVIKSKIDGNKYVGVTNNLKRRLDMHNSGRVFATKKRRPLFPIYIESYLNQNDAAARERFLKSGWGKQYLYRVLKNWFATQRAAGIKN